jgi:hypothetical protein
MTLSRRAVLRGAGAMVGLPFLEAMIPSSAVAQSAPKPPLRMGIVTVAGGTVIESWKTVPAGPLTRLPSILRDLEGAKEDLLLISGLSHHGRSEGLNAHEHCAFLHLTGAEEVRKVGGRIRAAQSVDQAAAEAAGQTTFFPSLEIGQTNHETRFSYRSADEPLPYESNVRLVFERMFRGRTMVVPNWNRRRAARAEAAPESRKSDSLDQSVVDLVLDEAQRLEKKLGAADRHTLGEYLASLRQIERRIEHLDAFLREEALDASAPGPSKPNVPSQVPERSISDRMVRWAGQDPEVHAEYIRLMGDLMILAFQTDTTRVATYAVGSDEAMFPGVVTVGYERHCHTLEHQGNADKVEHADPIAREACRQIHSWYTALFSEMVRKMKAIDEGGSSLLDNCMILYTSYMADGGHGRDDYPVLLVGRAGGTVKTGRHLAFPKGVPVSNLYVEMLDRMGAKAEAFGESKTSKHAAFGGRLPGLA